MNSETKKHQDSTAASVISHQDQLLNQKFNRQQKGDSVVYIITSSQLPIVFRDEFTEKIQRLVVKLDNFPNRIISAEIKTVPENLNIRFNQIRLPSGIVDGPFTKNISQYPVTGNGQIVLRASKNLMADGESQGKFVVSIQ